MENNREYDIIIWGASGFTGRLVAEYLYKNYNAKDLNWAIAGRDELKLSSIREKFLDNTIPIVLADSFNENSLNDIVKKTKVVCSTVGPYAKYGSLLVKSCVKNKTHYCDLAGEAQWIRKMIDLYHKEAITNQVKIVNSCGFDSIPSDMGVYFIYKNILKKNLSIKMRVTGAKGGYSGGTYASMQNIIKEASINKEIRRNLTNPYGLNPIGEQSGMDKSDLRSVIYDSKIKTWISPFLMAGINTKIVRRSNALSNYNYGKEFKYDEAVMTGTGFKGRLKGIILSIPLIFLSAKPGSLFNKIFNFLSPKPGKGPNKKERESGYFSLRFYVFQENNDFSIYKVTGDKDPGYGSTSKMLAESAVCLAKDELNNNFGILTPSIAMSDSLLDRLVSKAGLKFSKIK
ncbi:MAG: saccharopine dehydrogenase [Flavobacteriales bacterium]|nr:MAG: saccharopine dehydrogenase [Flavobacteriales bacterium]CAI8361666.1 MAG: Putative trans-acting enoyl reductase [Flavobacteriales bacterium]|tara:strand:- start:654 stop:1856 length:1203 start_codon:yes stop_codon:yes gene_type:complete